MLHFLTGSAILVVLATTVSSETSTNKAYVQDVTVPYFSDVILLCDHPNLNVSQHADDIKGLSWVFPDGTNVNSAGSLNKDKYGMLPPDSSVTVVGDVAGLGNYNLTVRKVDDDVFGYYLCVVEYKAPADKTPVVIRWGLNVDGADFSELLDTYKKNAIIGGVAAAVMLVLVGGGCLFWQYRYYNREFEEEEVDLKKNDAIEAAATKIVNDAIAEAKVSQSHVYNNASYNPEVDSTQIEVHVDSNKGKENNMVSIPL